MATTEANQPLQPVSADVFIRETKQVADRLERLRRICGMWRDRDDLIPLEELRQESIRY